MAESLTVLIIDDNPDDRDHYIRLLKKAQEAAFRYHEATEGDAGIEMVEELLPDCVLLDYSLPGANGLEVLKRIKRRCACIPVIMLTGQGSESIAVQAIKEGADDYLSKSAITLEALSRSIHTAIEHSRLQRVVDEQKDMLLKNETRYQQLIDGARDYAFFWLDTEGRIESWNSGAEKMLGYTAQEIIGQDFSISFAEEDRHNGMPSKTLQNALEKGQFISEGWRVCKSGNMLWAGSQIDALRSPDGKLIGFVEVMRDITERKDAETQRQKLVEKLMQSNTELERFAYVASHDMQEPVRMVINFSKIIAEYYGDRFDEEGKKYLKFITESADRIHRMIDDLLDYARMGSEERDATLVNGAEELDHVLVNLGELIREKGAQITFDALPSFPGNPVQFMRLMQNLIANAIKYQQPGNTPKVHISVEDQGTAWLISVKDNGIGIDEAFVRQIFEPFRRLHSWEQIKGTGLGLAVCKKIVENHGGAIWAVSTPRQGSTFFVTISKQRADRQKAA